MCGLIGSETPPTMTAGNWTIMSVHVSVAGLLTAPVRIDDRRNSLEGRDRQSIEVPPYPGCWET
ncbi:hypothetical protein JMJ77_0013136 [Colletotrichum scovillei]|uniref:Uncharacterized protein n=1 Tax=Colletotrichum scovillei TaxID=1209932 RepID=A0A9P7R6E9_9PEZI|nr:hypothetical protein JMJ77_0013136 [Colletotrichum scovillei]KAG7069426.1 hypothetical protein JMJ76_0003098 [Colletotrichum scovillei]KAG7073342.1 hypothetical protein JMJ78_0014321 [Colletotrichum scovillei]